MKVLKELSENKIGRIAELDALRGIAALIVFFFHCSLINPSAGRFVRLGVTGVDIFFIISGFSIFLTLNRTSRWQDFVINRLTRLFPTYWICVSFTAFFFVAKHLYSSSTLASDLAPNFLGNLTMFQPYLHVPYLDEQYWTLTIEMLFYITMLVIFLAKRLESIEKIGYGVLVLIIIYDVVLERYFNGAYIILNRNFPLLNHFPLFFSGILFYKASIQKATITRYVAIFCCFMITCMLYNNGGRSMFYISFVEYIAMVSIYFILFFLAISNYLRFIVWMPLLFLGKISYSFYLVHQYVSSRVIIPLLNKYFSLGFFYSTIIALCVCLLLASLITFYIENPAIKYWKGRLKKYNPI